MVQDDVHQAGVKVASHLAQIAAGNTDETDQSLGFEFADRVQGAAGFDHVGEIEPLRVMEVVDVEAIDAQAGGASRRTIRVPGRREECAGPGRGLPWRR